MKLLLNIICHVQLTSMFIGKGAWPYLRFMDSYVLGKESMMTMDGKRNWEKSRTAK
jgi:hypothetical protein